MIDLTGKKFGKLSVITLTTPLNGRRRWRCKCDCGKELAVIQYSLTKGATKTCGCGKRALGADHSNWHGYKGITGSQWCLIKANAKHRKIKFNLKIEDAWTLFENQGQRCIISKLPIQFAESYNRNLKYSIRKETTASLDRIDSSKGYVKGNVQWVHKDINLMKGSMPQAKFIALCRLITQANI